MTAFKSGLKYAFYFILVGSLGGIALLFSINILDEGFAFVFSSEGLGELAESASSLFLYFGYPIIVYSGGLGFAVGYARGKSR